MNKYWIVEDIWREIKTYIFHNIKIHGKHLKNDKYVINFNKVVKSIPGIYMPRIGPRIIYCSAKKSFRFVKFVYKIQAPCTLSKRRHSLRYKLIIEYMAHQELNEEEVRQEYYSKLNHLCQMDQPPPRITML